MFKQRKHRKPRTIQGLVGTLLEPKLPEAGQVATKQIFLEIAIFPYLRLALLCTQIHREGHRVERNRRPVWRAGLKAKQMSSRLQTVAQAACLFCCYPRLPSRCRTELNTWSAKVKMFTTQSVPGDFALVQNLCQSEPVLLWEEEFRL